MEIFGFKIISGKTYLRILRQCANTAWENQSLKNANGLLKMENDCLRERYSRTAQRRDKGGRFTK